MCCCRLLFGPIIVWADYCLLRHSKVGLNIQHYSIHVLLPIIVWADYCLLRHSKVGLNIQHYSIHVLLPIIVWADYCLLRHKMLPLYVGLNFLALARWD
jgi:uncharacterized membrane protein (UPF0136 family)